MRSRRFRKPSAPVPTRYRGVLFRSRLEARWAAFFDLASVAWEYEPDNTQAGWWPDFRVSGVEVFGDKHSFLTEVKPVAFSPLSVDGAFSKALIDRWVLMLGKGPAGDYIGFLARKQGGQIKTIAIRLTDDGLQDAPLNRADYGAWASKLWRDTNDHVQDPGISAAINAALEAQMGKRVFHFEGAEDDAS